MKPIRTTPVNGLAFSALDLAPVVMDFVQDQLAASREHQILVMKESNRHETAMLDRQLVHEERVSLQTERYRLAREVVRTESLSPDERSVIFDMIRGQ